MKPAVLMPIQPYYVFLIIARLMGWDIPQEKTIEVRKDFPKDNAWNKVTQIYCSKNRKSFNRIPKQFKPLMQKLLGKVIGEFVCDRIDEYPKGKAHGNELAKAAGLYPYELTEYSEYYKKDIYAWSISDLKIYDNPKELREFFRPVKYNADGPICGTEKEMQDIIEWDCETVFNKESTECTLKDCPKLQEFYRITRPPQSWCYVEVI